MADIQKPYTLNPVSGGDKTNDAIINKIDPNIDDVYTWLTKLRKMQAGTSAPTNPNTNDFWLDTSTTPPTVKRYDGTDWVSDIAFSALVQAVSMKAADFIGSVDLVLYTPTKDTSKVYIRSGTSSGYTDEIVLDPAANTLSLGENSISTSGDLSLGGTADLQGGAKTTSLVTNLNADMVDGYHAPFGHEVRAYVSSMQSVSPSTFTVVQFDAESFDVGGDFDTTTYRYTAPVGGKYAVDANVEWLAPSSAVHTQTMIYKNGSLLSRAFTYRPTSGSMTTRISDLITLAAGDYIDIRVVGSVGGTIASGDGNSWLTVRRVA